VSDFDKALGYWMLKERELRNISQEALALQLGRDQPSLSKIERGLRRTTVSDLLHWAVTLGVPEADLNGQLLALRERFYPTQSIANRCSDSA